ncbi:MAG: class I fructose-bisphosphate aldolase [Candidatus Paceibacterota bacterium]|jgi:fructose-bisphosphate aldolase class I
MNQQILTENAKKLVEKPKGILAIDESTETCTKRFEKLGVPSTEENRRKYRELLITAPDIENYVSGMILFDETIRQKTVGGKLFTDIFKEKGIQIGIKVDKGTKDFAQGEKITDGLEGLSERLIEYKNLGATFAKWRAVITIGEELPTDANLDANTNALARYAALCQEQDIVPIVEPEVIADDNHSIEQCYDATARTLKHLFNELSLQNVFIPGVILKTSMVYAGTEYPEQSTPEEVAEMTIKCLKENVPADIGGIVFLSGGQDEVTATKNLQAMHTQGELPWPLTFSYGRAIQNPALQIWAKDMTQIIEAQTALVERAHLNSLASIGKYEGE